MILHITNDFSGSTVYMNMIRELDLLGISQIIYNPIREKSRIGKNKIELTQPDSKIIYSHILTKYSDRIFYRKKIHKIVKDIEQKIDLSKVKFIHAHTWYSDGGAAYILSKKYNIPYIVAIRNTDLNLFLKYFVLERNFGKKILTNAKNIITINSIYKKRLLNHDKLKDLSSQIEDKTMVIVNGVDPFWIKNYLRPETQTSTNPICQLVFVGKFEKGKNVINLIQAVNNSKLPFKLTLIGGGGSVHQEVIRLVNNSEKVEYLGKIDDKEKLQKILVKSDFFVMPSRAETFGLVYVEAMLNGLPILYTANEGIDGCYQENIGEKVSNLTSDEIQNKIETLYKNKRKYEIPTDKLIVNHNWSSIAEKYQTLYKNL